MTKVLDDEAVARAMHNSVKLAQHGTPEQKAGMFRPNLPPKPAPAKRKAS